LSKSRSRRDAKLLVVLDASKIRTIIGAIIRSHATRRPMPSVVSERRSAPLTETVDRGRPAPSPIFQSPRNQH